MLEDRVGRYVELDEDSEIYPVPGGMDGGLPAPDLTPLSAIIAQLDKFHRSPGVSEGDMAYWIVTVVNKAKDDKKFEDARQRHDRKNAEQEHTRAVRDTVVTRLNSNTALVGAFFDDEGNLRNRLNARLYRLKY